MLLDLASTPASVRCSVPWLVVVVEDLSAARTSRWAP